MRRYVFRFALLAGIALAPSWARADEAEDRQIGQTIAQRLSEEKKSGGLKNFSLDLQVEDGTVWLSGRVASAEQQARALDIARRVKGVKQVVNDITVTTNTPEELKPAGALPLKPTTPKASGDDAPSQSRNMLASMNLPEEPKPTPTLPKATPMISPINPTPVSSILQSRSEIGSGVSPSTSPTAPGVQHVAARPTTVSPIPQTPGYGYGSAPPPAQAYAPHAAQIPMAYAPARYVNAEAYGGYGDEGYGAPVPMHTGGGMGIAPARYDHPAMPNHAWPSYAAYPNYAAVTYPKQYSPTAWPYIGPFYPYPQVPLGWRKVTLEWDDGWWFLDFKNRRYR
jgi:hypothetical protein